MSCVEEKHVGIALAFPHVFGVHPYLLPLAHTGPDADVTLLIIPPPISPPPSLSPPSPRSRRFPAMPMTIDPRLRKRTAGGRPKVGLAPRRKPPCLPGFAAAAADAVVEAKAAALSASCSSACAVSEVSINSTAGVGKQSLRPTSAAAARRKKWEVDGIEVLDIGIGAKGGRRITRSYYKQKKGEKPVRGEELSDVSCAESISGVGRVRFSKRRASSIGEVQEEKKPAKVLRLGNRMGDNSNSVAVASFSEKVIFRRTKQIFRLKVRLRNIISNYASYKLLIICRIRRYPKSMYLKSHVWNRFPNRKSLR